MIQPIRNNVLVKCFKGSEKSEGGILVPEAFRKESNKVEVIAVGNGLPQKPMKLKKGDIGHRVKDWGQEIVENGEKYYLMDASAIIALQ
jgi:chaperonin GroES